MSRELLATSQGLVGIPGDFYIGINKTFAVLQCIVMPLICGYHLYTARKNSSGGVIWSREQPGLFFANILVISSVYYIITLTIDIFGLGSFGYHFCHIYGKYFGVPSYIILKLFIYLVLVCRLHMIYKSSNYGYSLKKLKIWGISLIVCSIINCFLIALTTETTRDESAVPMCMTQLHGGAAGCMTLLDIVAGTVNTILFVKPLLQLYKTIKMAKAIDAADNNNENNQQEDDGDGAHEKLKIIAKKQAYLTIIAILTTIIALVCVTIFLMPQVFPGTDVVVSNLCIILMYKWNGKITDKCFYCCLKENKAHMDKNMMTKINVQKKVSLATATATIDVDADNTPPAASQDIEITTTNTNTDATR